ncbi:MAG: DNA translocase FtsK [Pseudomonadota bacterium]
MDREEFVRANQHSLAIESVMKRMKSPGQVTETVVGPMVVTQYFTPGSGVKKSDVQKVNEDIARALKVGSIRIVAVEGKQDILIEVPRLNRRIVDLGELMQSEAYTETGAELPVILGRDTQDEICVIDLAECPHILMAGTTGSGKSVCLNSMLLSLIESGRSLKFIMIDPKIVELSIYDGIPHLIEDVVTKPEVAKETLELAVSEMENRYETFKNLNIRNIQSYHAKGKELP